MINIGILGCGWITENAHIPALQKIDEVKISALYDINLERAEQLGKKLNIDAVYDDFEMFVHSGICAVVIATPNYTHADYTKKLLSLGKHVLCEKPIAFTSEEINEIIALSEEKHLIYMPGFVNRWRWDIETVCEYIYRGEIGKIKNIQAGWLRKNGIPRPGTWFTKKSFAGGGVLIDLGSHILDICRIFLAKNETVCLKSCCLSTSACSVAKTVETSGAAQWFKKQDVGNYNIDVEDSALAEIILENDISLSVTLSWHAPVEGDCTYFYITGENGKIELKTLFGFSNERLWKDDVLRIISNDGEEKYFTFDSQVNHSKKAFEKMHKTYINYILHGRMEDNHCVDMLNTVSWVENMYNCQIEKEEIFTKKNLEEVL